VGGQSAEEPARRSAAVPGDTPDRVLLSGATGFLGTFLLRALLSQTRAEVRCLVRADDARSARERLDACVRSSGVGGEIEWRRVVPLVADLSRPGLGLPETAFRELGRGVSAIYHSGAMLDFVRPYEALEPTNVGGTREMLRLREIAGGAALHYVSSIGVLPEGHPELAGLAEVAAPEKGRTLIHGGYCRSKRVAEQLVVRAGALGAPVVVYRPGLISGHSRTGAWKIDDAICKIIKGTIQAGVAPDVDWRMALVPVDFVADALVTMSRQPGSRGRFFHLVGPEAVRWSQLVNHLRRRGYAIASRPYGEWLDALAAPTSAGAPNEAACLLPWLRADCPMLDVDYDASSARAALAGSSIACPPVDEAMLDRYLDALVSAGFLAAPTRRKDGERAASAERRRAARRGRAGRSHVE